MNTGSFGSAIGGSQSIKDALARRNLGQGAATQQVSPTAPGFDPSTQAPQPPLGQAPQMPPTGTTAPQVAAPQAPLTPMGTPSGSGDDNLIIKALSEKLRSNAKILEAALSQPTPLV